MFCVGGGGIVVGLGRIMFSGVRVGSAIGSGSGSGMGSDSIFSTGSTFESSLLDSISAIKSVIMS